MAQSVSVKTHAVSDEAWIKDDEQLARSPKTLDQIISKKPAFQKGGTITSANASSLNDGASALVLCSETGRKHVKPMAKIIGT